MAGVLELIRLIGPKKQLSDPSERVSQASSKALELQAAMEILSEVFGLRISEVEEMLLERGKAKAQLLRQSCGTLTFLDLLFYPLKQVRVFFPEGSLEGFAHLSAHGEPGRRELKVAES